jgi:uncharacterized protein YcbX
MTDEAVHEGYITWTEFERNQRLIVITPARFAVVKPCSRDSFAAVTAVESFTLPTAARTELSAAITAVVAR